MKLHLLRHAKAMQDPVYQNDINRALSEKGIRQSNAMGKYLENLNFQGEVWCSAAKRTKQTLEYVNQHARLPEAKYMNDLYLCSKTDFLEKIWKNESAEDLFVVGHNFGITDLLNYLTEEEFEMKTCAYYCIEFNQNTWMESSKGTGKVISNYRP